jgi:type I restriction enzyme S subunit
MNVEQFFEKFELIADAPHAVAKMRELVLELAVQGKVADQDASDEPAAELLKRLIAFKLENPLSGRSGRSKVGAVELEARSAGLPSNWVHTTIGEVLYVVRGASPRPKGDPQYFSETRTPYHWVKISDIRKHGENGLLKDTDEFLTEAGMRKYVLLLKGTLVLTNSATIGVPIVLGIEGCCIHDGYLAFPNFPHDLLSQKFVRYLFHTLKKHAEQNARGLAQLNLNTELVRSFPFGLPPLAEQKRIVAKVDELMALCDQLEAQQQERDAKKAELARAALARFAEAPTPANLEFIFHKSYDITPADLRKSILTLAVQGKLVPQDPNDEPAEILLARLMTRNVQDSGRRKRSQPDLAITPEAIPYELPSGWAWQRLGNIGETNIGLTYSPQDVAEVGIPVLRSSNIQNGKLDLDDLVRVTCEPKRSVMVQDGDLLICVRNGSRALVGKVAVLEDLKEPAAFGAFMAIYRSEVNSYLYHFIRSPLFRQMIDEVNTTTINQITQSNLRSTLAPIPPFSEQLRIVEKVNQLMALVDELELHLTEARLSGSKLLDSIITDVAA